MTTEFKTIVNEIKEDGRWLNSIEEHRQYYSSTGASLYHANWMAWGNAVANYREYVKEFGESPFAK